MPKLTPFEKLIRANNAHITAIRKTMAKIRAEKKQGAEVNSTYMHYEHILDELEMADSSLRRENVLYKATNEYEA